MSTLTVEMTHNSPNYDKGQRGTVDAEKATGLCWVEFGIHRQWSFGQSESTGCWCGPSEFKVVTND